MAAAAAKAEDGRRRACAAVKPVSLLKTVSAWGCSTRLSVGVVSGA